MPSGNTPNKPRKTKSRSLRLTQALDEALQRCVDATGKKQTQIVTEALSVHLRDYLGAVDSPQITPPQQDTGSNEELQERVRHLEQTVETLRLAVNQSVTTANFCLTTLQTVLQNSGIRLAPNSPATEAQSSTEAE